MSDPATSPVEPAPLAEGLTVAVAGASGFIGAALCAELADRHHVIGLGRSKAPVDTAAQDWRTCDLYSLQQVEAALRGVDVAVYLVHSMLPSARLTQSSFADLDLLLADNFSRAAESAGVKRILYVSGFVPDGHELSTHLESRFEVERALGRRTPMLTTLRAGIVIGPQSSSFWILLNLVRRLPFMLLPRWTESRTQPVALHDLLRALRISLEAPVAEEGSFDIGGAEVLTYRELMHTVARVLGVRRFMVGTRFFSPRFSRLWVTVFGSAPKSLVAPLIESLRHEMVVEPNSLQERLEPDALPLEEAIRRALPHEKRVAEPLTLSRWPKSLRQLRADRRARSVQRLPLPEPYDALRAAEEYMRFLPSFTRPWIRVEVEDRRVCRFLLASSGVELMRLVFCAERSTRERCVFDVEGGLMVRDVGDPGRLEFRVVEGKLLAAVHDFAPALPWPLYSATQARVHLWVMRGFGRHLARAGADAAGTGVESTFDLPAGSGPTSG